MNDNADTAVVTRPPPPLLLLPLPKQVGKLADKPMCSDDGFHSTGGGSGAWTGPRFSQWEPDACFYPSLLTASREDLRGFFSTTGNLLIWGDSISGKFFEAMRMFAGREKVRFNKINAKPVLNGHGLGVLFDHPFDTTPTDSTSPSSTTLGPGWQLLLEQMKSSDLVVLNSGLHDVAPFWDNDDGGEHSGWHGDKPLVFQTYEWHLDQLFGAIAAESSSSSKSSSSSSIRSSRNNINSSSSTTTTYTSSSSTRNGLSLVERVLWRTTTFPHVFWEDDMDHGGSQWYRRCDTQRLSIKSVVRLNTIATRLARKHGIALWDVAPLSLAVPNSHALDGVHPAGIATGMWARILYSHRVAIRARHAFLANPLNNLNNTTSNVAAAATDTDPSHQKKNALGAAPVPVGDPRKKRRRRPSSGGVDKNTRQTPNKARGGSK
jgi:hypothetical protein